MNPLIEAIVDMREEDAVRTATEMLDKGISPLEVLDACHEAMAAIGQRFEEGTYFLPELLLAGEMLGQISDKVKPRLQAQAGAQKKLGRVVIGTVAGDIHDIGKNIVTFMLDANGFEVRDLGVDVSPLKFVEAIRDFRPQVVGLSGFLTLAFDAMKETVEAIKAAGLRDGVKIMIGGGQVNDKIQAYAGADAYGRDAVTGVSLAKKWVGAK
jgi:5-methyltetrahydrofolate--homocysteine methyltransferase